MTVPGINTLTGPAAAYCRPVARLAAEPAPLPQHTGSGQPRADHTRADQELARIREWPLRSYRELRGLPVSVRYARMHARKVICAWGLEPMTDTVELLVSEITTNAVRAAAESTHLETASGLPQRTPRLRFWLTSDRRSVLIQVWDWNNHLPVRRRAGLDAEAGRGLLLVQTLSDQWGCYAPEAPDGTGGKIVWALCAP